MCFQLPVFSLTNIFELVIIIENKKSVGGGTQMALETINKLKSAEQLAQVKENFAKEKAQSMVAKAEKEAKRLVEETCDSAQLKANHMIGDARKQAEDTIKYSVKNAEKDAQKLKTDSLDKESVVVNAIILQII